MFFAKGSIRSIGVKALLATIDGKLQNLDSLNRSRTVSLIHSMARALSHFQSSDFPVASSAASTPVVLQIVVSEASTHVGGLQLESYGGILEPSIEEGFLPQNVSDVDDNSIVEPLPEPTVEDFEHDNFPEAAFVEGEEHDDDYTPEEWEAWDAGAYDSHEYGGASEEFAEQFDEYYSDDY
ncbi:hypothetical protein CYMTET_8708 [Cymbomonas tetramitiformis]|uniref:Uncharacterized protein n=1 Tax=Cymbomonas tetramitiformis TaxID=36881 RepID=A0AAE0LFU8_9CHLO|nr:hypothetical protein CYMTET_8708 [Cymbomonas tetramitiformis]